MKTPHILLLADENLERNAVNQLKRIGFDITYNDKGLKNSTLIRLAKSQGRVLITHDTDFGNQDHYPPSCHCGILIVNSLETDAEKIFKNIVQGIEKLSDRPKIVFI